MKKPNKLTAGANLQWESSRMMLPEHVSAINQHKRESMKKVKPVFDEQHFEQVERMVRQYIESDVSLEIVIFGEYEDSVYNARITKYDSQLRRMKLEWTEDDEDQYEWVRIEEIVDIYV